VQQVGDKKSYTMMHGQPIIKTSYKCLFFPCMTHTPPISVCLSAFPLLIFILTIHSQLIHILASCFFYSGLPAKIFYAILSYLICAKRQAHIIRVHLMINTNYGCRYYANFNTTFSPSGLYLSNCTQSSCHSVYCPRAINKTFNTYYNNYESHKQM